MNRLLIVVVLLVIGIVGLGIYQGWFNFTSDNSDDKANINLKVDKDKIQEDEKKAVKKVQDLGHQVKDKLTAPSENNKDKTVPPTQPPPR
jgi:hypothetical protein